MSTGRIQVHDKTFVPYIKQAEIEAAIASMAKQMAEDLLEKDPLFVCIMNGAFMFATELLKQLPGEQEVAFARYSSYQGTQSTCQLREIMPVTVPLKGRTVVILEDLIDTGFTIERLKERFLQLGAEEVLIATMLLKPHSLKTPISPDYVGLTIDSGFIVGYGLDYNERGRTLTDIYIIES